MTSLRENHDVTEGEDKTRQSKKDKEVVDLPPIGTSLHKRRRGEPPASLSVKPHTPSDPEGSSPCTAGPTTEEYWVEDVDSDVFCDRMLERLKEKDDLPSKRGRELAIKTKETIEVLDQLDKLLDLLNQFVTLKEQNGKLLRKLRDVNYLKRLHSAHKKIDMENDKIRKEMKEIEILNEAFDGELEFEYGQAILDNMMTGTRMKRSGSKWKGHGKFGGSLLRKQRSRSSEGDENDVPPGTPSSSSLRRRSEGIFAKDVEKSKVSKWTRVKAAFK